MHRYLHLVQIPINILKPDLYIVQVRLRPKIMKLDLYIRIVLYCLRSVPQARRYHRDNAYTRIQLWLKMRAVQARFT